MKTISSLVLVLSLVFCSDLVAAKKKRRRYSGPPPTHPVVLWSRTLAESNDLEQRRVAAFKMSQYSQTIYQEPIVKNLLKCAKDTDDRIKVLCTKALGKAGTQAHAEMVRNELLSLYKNDPELRSTVVRVFIRRNDTSGAVQDVLLDTLQNSTDNDEVMTLLSYFEKHGNGSNHFVDVMLSLYEKANSAKTKRGIVKAAADRGQGQGKLVDLLVACSEDKDTPLALICLSGLEMQARTSPQAWNAVKKTIESEDPDVVLATLDVISNLPETPSPEISARLIQIVQKNEDVEVQEKAVLALGVAGDHTEPVVALLEKLLNNKGTEENVRIAAALVAGKQANAFPEKIQASLASCNTAEKSQSLKNACKLGMQDLESRKIASTKPEKAGEKK